MIRRRSRSLLALLLLAAVLPGCNAEEMDEPEGPSPQLGGRLEPGVEVQVRLWGQPADYVYPGKAGQVIDLSVASRTRGLDPNVQLLDPAGSEEAFDDDGGENGDALIRDHALLHDGDYKVRIDSDESRPGEVAVLLSVDGNVEGGTAIPLGTDLP